MSTEQDRRFEAARPRLDRDADSQQLSRQADHQPHAALSLPK